MQHLTDIRLGILTIAPCGVTDLVLKSSENVWSSGGSYLLIDP
jgi:hypothetical protein